MKIVRNIHIDVMDALRGTVLLLLLMTVVPVVCFGEQFVLFDDTINHNGIYRPHDDWNFVSRQEGAPGALKNWLNPVNYADGKIHLRYDISEVKELCGRFRLGFGFWNREVDPTIQHCVWWSSASGPGIYEFEYDVKSFWHGPGDSSDPVLPWDFESAFKRKSFFTIIDPPYDSCIQKLYPVKMHLTVWIIAEGDEFVPPATAVEQQQAQPPETVLQPRNHPNPFNASTTIEYTLPRSFSGYGTLTVYDVRGARVRTLVDGMLSPGTHTVVWNGFDDNGVQSSSGLYIYALKTGDFTRTGRMLLVR